MPTKELIFHKGPPPHIGWWRAKLIEGTTEYWGWFDGYWWSPFCTEDKDAAEAARRARQRGAFGPDDVKWSDYWPENARVERIVP